MGKDTSVGWTGSTMDLAADRPNEAKNPIPDDDYQESFMGWDRKSAFDNLSKFYQRIKT